ncbi:MAG: hypothetical protein IJB36_03335 [Clostridia bacterium]|nr:hypothetical protein [Clostridia bacterium]
MPRQYQHMLSLLPQIKEMLEKGMSHREIEKKLGLVGDIVMKIYKESYIKEKET